jgi:hypothetical protein
MSCPPEYALKKGTDLFYPLFSSTNNLSFSVSVLGDVDAFDALKHGTLGTLFLILL